MAIEITTQVNELRDRIPDARKEVDSRPPAVRIDVAQEKLTAVPQGDKHDIRMETDVGPKGRPQRGQTTVDIRHDTRSNPAGETREKNHPVRVVGRADNEISIRVRRRHGPANNVPRRFLNEHHVERILTLLE